MIDWTVADVPSKVESTATRAEDSEPVKNVFNEVSEAGPLVLVTFTRKLIPTISLAARRDPEIAVVLKIVTWLVEDTPVTEPDATALINRPRRASNSALPMPLSCMKTTTYDDPDGGLSVDVGIGLVLMRIRSEYCRVGSAAPIREVRLLLDTKEDVSFCITK